MNKNKLLGLMGLIGSAFIGGAIMPSLIRWGTELVHPFVLNWFRVSIGIPIILLFFRKRYRLKTIFAKKNLSIGLVLALGLCLNITMFAFGVQHTTLIASQLIYVATPIVTGLLANLLLKEQIHKKKILGMILALSGILTLLIFSRSPEERTSLGSFYGNFLIFTGMFGYSTYLTFSKKLSNKLSLIEMMIATNSFVAILLSPMALYALGSQGIAQLNLQSISVICLIGLVALLFTTLVQLSIKNLSATSTSFSSLLSPEFAALAGIAIYNEKLSFILLISMILSIGGTILSIRAEKATLLDKIKVAAHKLKGNK